MQCKILFLGDADSSGNKEQSLMPFVADVAVVE